MRRFNELTADSPANGPIHELKYIEFESEKAEQKDSGGAADNLEVLRN